MTFLKKRKKLIIGLVIACVSVFLVIVNVRKNPEGNDTSLFSFGSDTGLRVEVEIVEPHDIASTVSATGYVVPLTKVNISPRISGEIVELKVDEGSLVQKGDLLLKLDSTQYEAALNQAKANYRVMKGAVTRVKAGLEDAEREFERMKSLFEEGVIPESQKDSVSLKLKIENINYRNSLEQVDQAKADLEKAEDNLSKTIIRSPMSGIVSQLNVELGEVVLGSISNLGTVMMTISDFSQMLVKADVEETNVVDISIDQSVRIYVDALPDEEHSGRLHEIANSARQKGDISVFPVEVMIQGDTAKLRPGMSADIDIVTNEHKNVLAVPIQSVQKRKPEQVKEELPEKDQKNSVNQDEDADQETEHEVNENVDQNLKEEKKSEKKLVEIVYLVEDGEAALRIVETGLSDDTYIEITQGLDEKDRVIVGPYRNLSKLKHGLKVQSDEDKEKKEEKPEGAVKIEVE